MDQTVGLTFKKLKVMTFKVKVAIDWVKVRSSFTGNAAAGLMYSQAMVQTDKVNPCFEPKVLY